MSASLPLSCDHRSGRAFGASVPLDRLAEATRDPSICTAGRWAGAACPSAATGRLHLPLSGSPVQ